jgi:hypothetical protein
VVVEVPGQLQFAESLDTDSLEEVQAYLELSIKGIVNDNHSAPETIQLESHGENCSIY